jgi:MFS family permease
VQFIPHSDLRSYGSLVIGVFLIGLVIASTLSGEALGRFGRTASRIEEQKKFWMLVAIDYVGGALGIGYFMYKVFAVSN